MKPERVSRRLSVIAFFLVSLCQAQAPVYTVTTLNSDLNSPFAVAVDPSGNIYIADQGNNRIRKLSVDGTISTVAGNGTQGYSGDKGAATSAELNDPEGVAVDADGNLYIADTNNSVIREVTKDGTINTIAGVYANGAGYSGDSGLAINAQISYPAGLAIDAAGNIYIADTYNQAVRKISKSDSTITTVAGNGTPSHSGDEGQARKATLNNPDGLTLDAVGNLYIADTHNGVIRKVATDGIISTVAGTINGDFSGDQGPAIKAQLNNPEGVAVDAAGNIFIADRFNGRIRMVAPNGNIVTVAGNGVIAYTGDGGPATSASFHFPSGVAVDAAGNLYVTDNGNNSIRKLVPVPDSPSINSAASAAGFGGSKSIGQGSWVEIFGSNLGASTRGWTDSDFKNGNGPTSLDGTSISIGGRSAFLDYVSPGQVNAQVPSNAATGTQQLIVTTATGASVPYTINVGVTKPGMLAPASFNIGGKQYAVALFSDGSTYVLPPGAVSGITSRQAKPGETITFYGIGFGPVTPNIPAGQIAPDGVNTLALPFQLSFGSTPATLSYYGLVPQVVGLYQFNVVVPNVTASDAVPLTFTLNGVKGTQTLYTAVGN